jgi:alkylation response protein AidB-like acyl-CoA dehydrogenase
VDFSYSPEDEAFRKEARDWLEENLPESWRATQDTLTTREDSFQIALDWQKRLYKRGWVGLTWPREYGGGGGTLMQQVILSEELAKARAPGIANTLGVGMAGPTIMSFGTEEQKKRFIPKILSGEEIWCQGFSEPDAGSDLANLKTRAIRDGDYYVVNGQKVWSTMAQYGEWCLLLVRTDPDAEPKHRGITYLLMDMKTPGIEVRPLKQMTGDSEFNEMFLDNVRVPVSNRLDEENRGWYVAMGTLAFERAGMGQAIMFKQVLNEVFRLAAGTKRNGIPAIKDSTIRQRLAQCAIECEIMRLNSYRSLSALLKGEPPGPEEVFSKLFWSEMIQRMAELATQILGIDSLIEDEKEVQRWQYLFLRSKGNTLEQGSSEILRNVIGERVLGIPR